jgi:hypothetical protein
MQVNTPVISLNLPHQLPASVRGWMLGQVLDAVVIGRDGQNSIRMTVAGTEVRAATALPLRSGDALSLRVSQLQPVITLTAASPSTTSAAVTAEQLALRTAVNHTLPRQQALAKAFDLLARVVDPAPATATSPARRTTLPVPAAQIAERLLASLPRYADVTDPARLPAIVRRLGIFAESALAKTAFADDGVAVQPERDLKLQLLRLRAELTRPAQQPASPVNQRGQETPVKFPGSAQATPSAADLTRTSATSDAADAPEDTEPLRNLARLVDGAIAKIETNQLKSVAAWLDGDTQLHFDLPVIFDEGHRDLRLQIFHEDGTATVPGGDSNTIVLEIPLGDDKTLRAAVALLADDLTVRLWSDDAGVRAIIGQRRDELVDRLRANGLENVGVSLVELKPFDDWGRKFSQLVDTTA